MRKWIALLVVVVIALISSIYLFTSPFRSFKNAVSIEVTPTGAFREIYNTGNWEKWWPGEIIAKNHFRFGKHDYRITDKKLSALTIVITGKADSMVSQLDLVVSTVTGLDLLWTGRGIASEGLFKRSTRLFDKTLQNETAEIVDSLRRFYSDESNIYGFVVDQSKIPDSSLISRSQVITGTPSTEFIYALIDELHLYISNKNCRETNSPMLNISKEGDSTLVRVAIPVDRQLPDSGLISYRRMVPGGLMSFATYHGGPQGSLNAISTMEGYLRDHGLNQPAIPYLLLITDRRAEPDTSKWVTRICCPYF